MINMMIRSLVAIMATMAVLIGCSTTLERVGSTTQAITYNVVGSPNSFTYGSFTQIDTVVEVDGSNTDRFRMHRVRKTSLSTFNGAVLLMPGQSAHFGMWTFSDTDPNPNVNGAAAYLADAGYDVYGYSPRTTGGATPKVTWDIQSIVDDVSYIRSQIAVVHGSLKPAIIGLSLGSITAQAVINAHPSDWSGIVIWEGMLYSNDTGVKTGNVVNCTQSNLNIAAGMYGNTTTALLVSLDPAVLRAVATVEQPCPVGFTPGYQLLRGTALAYTYASQARLTNFLANFNSNESASVQRDFVCALSGNATYNTHYSNLGSFTGHVYMIHTGHGFGGRVTPLHPVVPNTKFMVDTYNLFTSAASRDMSNYQSDFGHADHYISSNWKTLAFDPIIDWLDNVVF